MNSYNKYIKYYNKYHILYNKYALQYGGVTPVELSKTILEEYMNTSPTNHEKKYNDFNKFFKSTILKEIIDYNGEYNIVKIKKFIVDDQLLLSRHFYSALNYLLKDFLLNPTIDIINIINEIHNIKLKNIILIDGLNIIRNKSIIIANLYLFKDNIILFNYMMNILNNIYSYREHYILLNEALPIILNNYFSNANIIIVLTNENRRNSTFTTKQILLEDKNNILTFIYLPKIIDDMSESLSIKPMGEFKSQTDDVFIILLFECFNKYFNSIKITNKVFILSGDKYKWYSDNNIRLYRCCLVLNSDIIKKKDQYIRIYTPTYLINKGELLNYSNYHGNINLTEPKYLMLFKIDSEESKSIPKRSSSVDSSNKSNNGVLIYNTIDQPINERYKQYNIENSIIKQSLIKFLAPSIHITNEFDDIIKTNTIVGDATILFNKDMSEVNLFIIKTKEELLSFIKDIKNIKDEKIDKIDITNISLEIITELIDYNEKIIKKETIKYKNKPPRFYEEATSQTVLLLNILQILKSKTEERIKIEREKYEKIRIDEEMQMESEKRMQMESERRMQMESERRMQMESEKRMQIEREKRMQIEREKRMESERIIQMESERRMQMEEDRKKRDIYLEQQLNNGIIQSKLDQSQELHQEIYKITQQLEELNITRHHLLQILDLKTRQQSFLQQEIYVLQNPIQSPRIMYSPSEHLLFPQQFNQPIYAPLPMYNAQ